MRVAVVDIGTNSTRLLIADVADGRLEELDRRSIVTRLGEGVDAAGRLGDEPQQRVFAALDEYAQAIDELGAETRTAVMTSAVRDAANGDAFAATVRERYGLAGRTLSGDEEARLTYLGATAARDPEDGTPLVVIDIGGGSTELVAGARGEVDFHVSTQIGVVRHTERHIASDPPATEELAALAREVRSGLEGAAPAEVRSRVRAAIAVAGTATTTAAIDLELEPSRPGAHRGPHAEPRAARRAAGPARRAAPRRAPRGHRAASRPRADYRGGSDHPQRGSAGLRARRRGGLRARHPVGRRARQRTVKLIGFSWTGVRLPAPCAREDTRPVGWGGRASRRRPTDT